MLHFIFLHYFLTFQTTTEGKTLKITADQTYALASNINKKEGKRNKQTKKERNCKKGVKPFGFSLLFFQYRKTSDQELLVYRP